MHPKFSAAADPQSGLESREGRNAGAGVRKAAVSSQQFTFFNCLPKPLHMWGRVFDSSGPSAARQLFAAIPGKFRRPTFEGLGRARLQSCRSKALSNVASATEVRFCRGTTKRRTAQLNGPWKMGLGREGEPAAAETGHPVSSPSARPKSCPSHADANVRETIRPEILKSGTVRSAAVPAASRPPKPTPARHERQSRPAGTAAARIHTNG